MKIAVTSQNFKSITGHAGKARRFIVFLAKNDGKWVESERLDLPKEMSVHEFKGQPHPIDDMDILITASCGDGFIRKMSSRGVEVYTTSEPNPFVAVNKLALEIPLALSKPHV